MSGIVDVDKLRAGDWLAIQARIAFCAQNLLINRPEEGSLPSHSSKRRPPWVAFLWPGFPHLWMRGSLAGLVLALAFSVLLNVLVLSTLVWPSWLETRLRFACGIAAAVLWLAALYETRCELRRIAAEGDDEALGNEFKSSNRNDLLLRDAQSSYLRGDWTGAERSLKRALRKDRRDVEARLWMAMLLRRSERPDQALRQLRRLERMEDATDWHYEIEQEKRLLQELAESTTEEPILLPIEASRSEAEANPPEGSSEQAA